MAFQLPLPTEPGLAVARGPETSAGSRRDRVCVASSPPAAASMTLPGRRVAGWAELGNCPEQQKSGAPRPGNGRARCKLPGTHWPQIRSTWRVCASSGALRWCTGDLCVGHLLLSASCHGLHPQPGKRQRASHGSRPPANPSSSRRRRRIPGPPGRQLAASRLPPHASNHHLLLVV